MARGIVQLLALKDIYVYERIAIVVNGKRRRICWGNKYTIFSPGGHYNTPVSPRASSIAEIKDFPRCQADLL